MDKNLFDEDRMECYVGVRATVVDQKDGVAVLKLTTTTIRPDDVAVLTRLFPHTSAEIRRLRKVEALIGSIEDDETE